MNVKIQCENTIITNFRTRRVRVIKYKEQEANARKQVEQELLYHLMLIVLDQVDKMLTLRGSKIQMLHLRD